MKERKVNYCSSDESLYDNIKCRYLAIVPFVSTYIAIVEVKEKRGRTELSYETFTLSKSKKL